MTVQVVEGDCMEVMKRMLGEKRRFDMIFLDPPYYEWASSKKPDHVKLAMLTDALLKKHGAVWLCGTIPQLVEDWKYWRIRFRLVAEVVWVKTRGTMAISRRRPLLAHENIWLLMKRDGKVSKSHLDFTSRPGRKVVKKASWAKRGFMRTRIKPEERPEEWYEDRGYMLSWMIHRPITPGVPEYVGHPTQKPLKLVKMLVKHTTHEQDWVLDPFAGSGTTLVACKLLNRNCVGIEVNPEYVSMIESRLSQAGGLT